MQLNIEEHLTPVNFVTGRNAPIRGVCIHTMQGTFDGTFAWFNNPASRVSAHYIVALDSGKVIRMVKESDTAWAEGSVLNPTNALVKQYGGNPNDYFISIENADNGTPASVDRTSQYPVLIQLVADICQRNNIPVDRDHICGHHEIRADKTCPGNIDVDYVVNEVKKMIAPQTTQPSINLDLQKIFDHYHVKSADELITSQDQQLGYLAQARTDLQNSTPNGQVQQKIQEGISEQITLANGYKKQYDDLWTLILQHTPSDKVSLHDDAKLTAYFESCTTLNDQVLTLTKAKEQIQSDCDTKVKNIQDQLTILQGQLKDTQTKADTLQTQITDVQGQQQKVTKLAQVIQRIASIFHSAAQKNITSTLTQELQKGNNESNHPVS